MHAQETCGPPSEKDLETNTILRLEFTNLDVWCYNNHNKPAYVIGLEGDVVFKVEDFRVFIPMADFVDEAFSKKRIEGTLWAAVDNRKEVPSVTPNHALEALRGQVELVRLCYKSGGLAERTAKDIGLPCILTEFNQSDDILIGLPRQEDLGRHLRVGSVEGIMLFPNQVAAVHII